MLTLRPDLRIPGFTAQQESGGPKKLVETKTHRMRELFHSHRYLYVPTSNGGRFAAPELKANVPSRDRPVVSEWCCFRSGICLNIDTCSIRRTPGSRPLCWLTDCDAWRLIQIESAYAWEIKNWNWINYERPFFGVCLPLSGWFWPKFGVRLEWVDKPNGSRIEMNA